MPPFNDAIQLVTAGTIAPVYLLAGGDGYLEDFFIGEVARHFLPPGSRKQVFALDDDRAEQVLAELNAYGLFQDRQLLVVHQIQRIKGTARDELIAYTGNPNPDKCLLLVMEEYQPTKGLQKSLAKSISVIDTRPPFPNTLRSLANYYAKQKGFILRSDALELLIDLIGDSAGHVMSELDKLFTQMEKGEAVTRELVEVQVCSDKSFQLWHLQESLARRETDRSLRICLSLLEYGTLPARIIGSLSTLFCQLLFIQTDTNMERGYTGLNKLVTTQLRPMRGLYTLDETTWILRKLQATDLSLKSTSVAADQMLIALVAGVCRGIG
ncbi:MAG: DNA polymerase III subunit delta [Fidelibacterota bacterium]|nr:MAG: DNA polymerase III subunit delta [Candidatus Neomarinimicrobiota bacterium]